MSPLAEHLECYLAIRRGLGFQLGTAARILRTFVTFVDTQGADHITTGVFLKWKHTFGQASRQTWAARLGTVRLFAEYLNGVDPRNEVPSRGLIPARPGVLARISMTIRRFDKFSRVRSIFPPSTGFAD